MQATETYRVPKLLAAGAFGQAVTLLNQLGFVPITIAFWGAPLAADWMVITALAGYLTFSDLGFSLAAGNRMCHAASVGGWDGVGRIYRTSVNLTLAATLLLIAVLAAVVAAYPLRELLNLTTISESGFAAVLACQAGLVLLAQVSGVEVALVRACGHATLAAMFLNLSRLAEFLVVGVAILWGAQPVAATVIMLVVRTGSWLFLRHLGYRLGHAVPRPPWTRLDAGLLRELFVPSLGFMAFPLAFALGNQFLLTTISAIGGPLMALAFSTTRTLTRIVFQFGSLLASATAVNFTFAFGRGDQREMRDLLRAALAVCFWGGILMALGLAFFGPEIYRLWTRGSLPVNQGLFLVLLADAVVASLWFSGMAVVGSANQHGGLAWLFAALNLGAVLAAGFLIPHFGEAGVAGCLLLGDLVLMATVLDKAARITGDHRLALAAVTMNPSQLPHAARRLFRR